MCLTLQLGLHLSGCWSDFRRLGGHIIPVNGKDKLIQPLAMAVELELPVFVVFDADGDNMKPDQRPKHEKDNCALLYLLRSADVPFPADNVWGANYAIWPTNLTKVVRADFPEADYTHITETVRQHYALEGGLEKNDLFIAEWVSLAHSEGLRSATLENLCESIIRFAST